MQGRIEALVAAMARHAASPGVQDQAARALLNLANDAENKRKIAAHEVVHALEQLLIFVPSQSHKHTHTHTRARARRGRGRPCGAPWRPLTPR
jgi:hypothetical protein